MDLQDYFDFIDDTSIRIKGHRIYIDEVLEEHLKGKAPEEILYCFKNLPLEKIYATLLYYEVNKAEIDAYLQRVRQYHEKSRQEWQATQGPTLAIVEERNRLRKERERLIAEERFHPILDKPAS
ncbi:DUF433 domain-containing protein [Candidatus Poribacteria bacterium]|nr:DUF433 domain-containing protein [Candidatus Poribacteria bacterium]